MPSLMSSVVYISEAVRTSVIDRIRTAVQSHECGMPRPLRLLQVFSDKSYNRTSFVIAGDSEYVYRATLSATMMAFTAAADTTPAGTMGKHDHPALGWVDHICVNPLGDPSSSSPPLPTAMLEEAGALARRIATSMAKDQGATLYLYGCAVSPQRKLRDVRRGLGYFSNAAGGGGTARSVGAGATAAPTSPTIAPDFGPFPPSLPGLGVTCIGAVSPILNFNVPLRISRSKGHSGGEGGGISSSTSNASEHSGAAASAGRGDGGRGALLEAALPLCRILARGLSEQNAETGLSSVEALALPYIAPSSEKEEESSVIVEIACNLLDAKIASPTDVLKRLRELAVRQAADAGSEVDSSSGGASLSYSRDGVSISLSEARAYTIGVPRDEQLRQLESG